MDYKRTFDKEDQELDFGIHSSIEHNKFNSVNNQYLNSRGQSLYYGTRTTIIRVMRNRNGMVVVWIIANRLVNKILDGTGRENGFYGYT